jgi:hypothetical protein
MATIRPKPGKDRLLAMLLESTDLRDFDLHMTIERTYRTGAGRRSTVEISRARHEKSVTAWRSFASEIQHRSLLCSVIPFASSSDALSSRSNAIAGIVRKPFSKLEVTAQGIVEGEGIPNPSRLLLYEEKTIGPNGPGGSRIIAGTFGHIVFVITFSALGELWSWDAVTSIAGLQLEKIQRMST